MNHYTLRVYYQEQLGYLQYIGWLLDSLIQVITEYLELISKDRKPAY